MNNLLYVDDLKLCGKTKDDLEALMNIVRIYTDDIKMESRISNCASIVRKRGKKAADDHYKIKHSCVVLLSVIPTDSDSG